jgi:hypothetical protein
MLSAEGLTSLDISRRTGIPRSTIRDWRNGRTPKRETQLDCGPQHLASLDEAAYAYLLGMYLGDGCISEHARGVYRLRITLDAAYPGIAAECAAGIEAVAPGKRAHLLSRRDQRAVDVTSYWKHWPCLIPQHGKGRKHLRRITLSDWQRRIVDVHVTCFIRGLIHSDGCRIIATERKGRSIRRVTRYAFKNRSEDILALFHRACVMADVHCTRASQTQIAVYSKAAVARLDEFVGPKT